MTARGRSEMMHRPHHHNIYIADSSGNYNPGFSQQISALPTTITITFKRAHN